MALAGTIIDAVIAGIEAIDGTGAYENDLSGTGQVVSDPEQPMSAFPSVQVFANGADPEPAEMSTARDACVLRVIVSGWVSGSTYLARTKAAASLASDLKRAVNVTTIRALVDAQEADAGCDVNFVRHEIAFHGSTDNATGVGYCRVAYMISYTRPIDGGI